MKNKCLYCYNDIEGGYDFHEKCSLSFFGTKHAPGLSYTLDQMSELAKEVVERSVAIPGVQAKLSMSLVNETKERSDTRLTVVGALGGNYIFKPPAESYPEMPPNEHLTMRIAESMGIRVVPSSLIRLASGELSYITKRIDRNDDGSKIHMLDMFQILEAYDKYKGSMEKIGKALAKYSGNTMLDILFYFELTLFSFITGNSDMHLKNFSMIKTPSSWALAQAYDLLNVVIINPGDKEELALPVEGKKHKLQWSDFHRFGENMGLSDSQILRVRNRFNNSMPTAYNWIEKSFLSATMRNLYKKVLAERIARINS